MGQRPDRAEKRPTSRSTRPTAPARRRRKRGPADVQQELGRLAGRNASRALGTLMAAADAFANDREREALRILRPLREQLPDSPSVRELTGLAQYRIGNYAAAAKELEAYAELTDAVDQHPVLMDCYRAQRRWRKVEELLAGAGRGVAERGARHRGPHRLRGCARRPGPLRPRRWRCCASGPSGSRSPSEHHLRLWYALADLEERAGNLARARELFDRVRQADPAFADVAERLAALG